MALGVAMAIQENGTDSLDYFAMLRGWGLAREGIYPSLYRQKSAANQTICGTFFVKEYKLGKFEHRIMFVFS